MNDENGIWNKAKKKMSRYLKERFCRLSSHFTLKSINAPKASNNSIILQDKNSMNSM